MANDRFLNIVVKLKDDASKQMANLGKLIGDNLKTISATAGVASGAIAGLAVTSLKNFADLGETIDNFTKATGISAESASALKLAAEGMGSSLDSVGTAVKKMQVNIAAMSEDTKAANEALKPLGITFESLKGKKPEEQFMAIGNAIGKIQDPALRTKKAMELLGKSGTEFLPIFAEGKASLEDMSKAAKEMGVSMDDIAVNKALALDSAFDGLQTSLSGLSQAIGSALSGSASDFINQLNEIIKGVTKWINENPELTAQIIVVAGSITALIAVLWPLVTVIGAVSAAFLFLAANPIVLVIAALAALALAIYMAITNWEEFKAGVMKVWNAVVTYISEKAGEILSFLATWLPQITNIWGVGWNLLQTALTLVWDNISGYILGKLGEIGTAIDNGMKEAQRIWNEIWGGIESAATGAIGNVLTMVNGLISGVSNAITSVKNLMNFSGGGAAGAIVSAASKSIKGKNANGGRQMGGYSYVVGEHGPEVFTPDQRSGGGTITPNSKMGGGDNITVIIKGNTLLDSQAAVKMGDMIIERLRLQRRLA